MWRPVWTDGPCHREWTMRRWWIEKTRANHTTWVAAEEAVVPEKKEVCSSPAAQPRSESGMSSKHAILPPCPPPSPDKTRSYPEAKAEPRCKEQNDWTTSPAGFHHQLQSRERDRGPSVLLCLIA